MDEYKDPHHQAVFGDKAGRIGEPIVADSMVHQMPPEQSDYLWRLRIDLRCLIDAPLNTNTESRMPSCYVEMGWSQHS